MSLPFPNNTDDWILEAAPQSDIVVSSRARLARNLPGRPFAPRAKKEELSRIVDSIQEAMHAQNLLDGFSRFDVTSLSANDRRYLRESHLISTEFEKGREHREVYLKSSPNASIMVNEEDHLRIQAMLGGLRLNEVHEKVESIECALEVAIKFAYHPQFGYLTACPTNTGTGLRVSVMLHLVALVKTNQVEEVLAPLANLGLTVRGAYGEHSGYIGDLFQISNEVTLGKTEEELIQMLDQVVQQVIERETNAREFFFKQAATKATDAVNRALGLLSYARTIDSGEAINLLSQLRLGINRDFGLTITHEELSRLMIDIQPAHLLRIAPSSSSSDERDAARAAYLRAKFHNGGTVQNN